ncbi:MAG: hypothetical protein B7Y39_12105 [Bdellovibrio sp. 28-41-41]|nr:MAG: hypothetical protein B7Y39_12105 [Bdellovibrio sp. 28-41-41]
MTKVEQEILNKALKTIESNIHKTISGREFVATGGNQFRTFWTRDFCYSVPGLLRIGKSKLVKSQLSLIYKFKNIENLLPRGIDRIDPKFRVFFNTAIPKPWRPLFLYSKEDSKFDLQIKGEYKGEHGTIAIDSNVLFVLAYFSYAESTQDYFLPPQEIDSLLDIYRSRMTSVGIEQPPFSDWQDSVNRTGVWLLLQVQILSALKKYYAWTSKEPVGFSISKTECLILDGFYSKDENIFYQSKNSNIVAIDTYGFIFTNKLFSNKLTAISLYQSLVSHPVWTKWSVPGVPVSDYYSSSEVSWTTKIVGLAGYHDHFHWGWLVAEAARISKICGDLSEYLRIVNRFSTDIQTTDTLGEIYSLKNSSLVEYKSTLYKSENPFTWTSAKWCEALTAETPNARFNGI